MSAAGTSWALWDLHVHSPASFEHQYGGDDDEVWERFISDLEALPEDFKVIGLNDYWFLDGYRRVLKFKEKGRLRNLEAIFPVVELRLSNFGGSRNKLSRINSHVIFDPDLGADTIQTQFISALGSKIQTSPEGKGLWSGVLSKESVTDLGHKIIESVPESERKHYGSPLREGFNNLNISWEALQDVLDNSYLQGKHLIGLGKTEWNDLKWSDGSIGIKKDLINSADVIFTAYADVSQWEDDVEGLKRSNVNHHLLDCSDAHYFSDSDEHMRIGNCQTWLKTTYTFAGLAYALREFERRVYVGIEPPALRRIRRNPENYLTRVAVKSNEDIYQVFNYELQLNPGFVAIVGNKGQGKSALLDCIALAGNSARQDEFAFLNRRRFLAPGNKTKAAKYTSTIQLESNKEISVKLTDEYETSAPELVEYLPQAFVERICSVDPNDTQAEHFEDELRSILFTHIPEHEREEQNSFNSLFENKTRTVDNRMSRARDRLEELVDEYVNHLEFSRQNPLTDVTQKLELKNKELQAAETDLVQVTDEYSELDEGKSDDKDLQDLRKESQELEDKKNHIERSLEHNTKAQSHVSRSLSEARTLFERARLLASDLHDVETQIRPIMVEEEPSAAPLIEVTIDSRLFDSWVIKRREYQDHLKTESVRLSGEQQELDEDARKNQEHLGAIDAERERARQRVADAKQRVDSIKGSPEDGESLLGLQTLKARIEAIPAAVQSKLEEIFQISQEIFDELKSKLDVVRSLYRPATQFIDASYVLQNVGLEFNAGLKSLSSWRNIPEALDRRKNGELVSWLEELPSRLDLLDWSSISQEIDQLVRRLNHDGADQNKEMRNPLLALRSTSSLRDFLFKIFGLTWLDVRFELTGEGKPLSHLSPGQRGLILSLFYLVVDQRTIPLLLDQPEENLDNETIAERLVPAIHEAATRRQMLVVTHNANLAVVGDADQIVHCSIDDGQFRVSSGSISEAQSAQYALDVLEGTKPAFDNRSYKYAAIPQLI